MLTNELLIELKKVVPTENVKTDDTICQDNSVDTSLYSLFNNISAEIVIYVETIEQIQAIVKLANKYNISIVCRGAGTNTVGSCLPINGGIVLNFSKMNKIIELNSQNMTAKVQAGVIIGDLQKAVENIGLFYPPDPASLDTATIGGSIAQNSAGARCFKYGATKDYVLELKVVTGEGKLIRVGSNTVKNSSGYNLGAIFVGSEGTLGIVVEATLKLIPKPQAQQVIMAYFDKISSAVLAVNKIIEKQIYPATIDFMDKNALLTVEQYKPSGIPTDKEALLLVEIDGFLSSLDEQRNAICKVMNEFSCIGLAYSKNEEERCKIWETRRLSMLACAELKPNVTTDDLIVPRENLVKLVTGIQQICKKYNLLLCMVGHVGDGSVHPQIPIDYKDKLEYERYKKAKTEMYNLTVSLNGIISGEHGIGIEKKKFLPHVIDAGALSYMKSLKAIFDPNNILNPNKIF